MLAYLSQFINRFSPSGYKTNYTESSSISISVNNTCHPNEHLEHFQQMMSEHPELINCDDITEPSRIFLLKVDIKKTQQQQQLDKLKLDLEVEEKKHKEQQSLILQTLNKNVSRINWVN